MIGAKEAQDDMVDRTMAAAMRAFADRSDGVEAERATEWRVDDIAWSSVAGANWVVLERVIKQATYDP